MLFASMGFVAAAQTTIEPGYAKRAIAECQRLHSNGEYATALTLIEKIDANGYAWVEKEYGVSIAKKEDKPRVVLGTCAVKESISHGSN